MQTYLKDRASISKTYSKSLLKIKLNKDGLYQLTEGVGLLLDDLTQEAKQHVHSSQQLAKLHKDITDLRKELSSGIKKAIKDRGNLVKSLDNARNHTNKVIHDLRVFENIDLYLGKSKRIKRKKEFRNFTNDNVAIE